MFEWTEERVSFMADACERTDFHEKLAALLSPYLKKTDSVCDAGCGLGYLSLALSPLVGHVTAAERDDRALDVLRRQLARRHIRNVTPLCTDVLAYTPSEPFDAMVFCFFGSMEEIVAAAVRLARELDGEVISADSMQVYRHMDIGSAKIRPEEMCGVPHYLIDVLDPSEEFHVVKFVELAHEAMEKIYAAGQIPIVTGGTGFYIQALLKEVDFTESHGELPIRKQLEEKAATEEGAAELYRELSEVDPASAETIHPNNVKRVIRALEYYHETGQKISEHNEEQKQKESPYCSAYFVLNDERSILYDRIDRRVDQMIRDGLVDEVFRLKEMGYTRDLVSMQGLGYKELFPYLAGECTLEEAVYIIKRDTRHFAKRQLTWFRREKDVIWLNKPDFDYDEGKILSYMLDRWNEIVSADAKEEGEQSC